MDGILKSFDEFIEHLKAHMADLHKPVEIHDHLYGEKDYPALKALVVASASKMERNVSKLHLLFSAMTVDSLISLLKETEGVFIEIVESERLFMCCGMCNAAKNEILDGMDMIFESISNLVEHCKQCYVDKKPKISPSMTGAVWDACKHLSTISDSNKRAVMKEAMKAFFVRIVRDVKKECDEYLNGEDDDDWDGLFDDMELDDGEEEEVEEDWPEEVRQQIVKEVEGIQHIFEELFKLFSSSIPDCVPMKEIEHLNVISDCERKICDGANNLGVMLYSKEENDKKAVKGLVASLTKLNAELSNLGETEEVRKMKKSIQERSDSLLALERIL
ncbi:hypothetical protein WA577_000646 [Blastocystis sp. JDR]